MPPTTSTTLTLTLTLGDALAVTLMERRGFVASDFGVYHPNGKQGAQMRTVADLMHSGDALPLLDEDATMTQVVDKMTAKGFGLCILLRDGKVRGVITDSDLRRNMDGLL